MKKNYSIDAIRSWELRNKSVDLALDTAKVREKNHIHVTSSATNGSKMTRWFNKKYKEKFGAWNTTPPSPRNERRLSVDFIPDIESVSVDECTNSPRIERKNESSIEELMANSANIYNEDVSSSESLSTYIPCMPISIMHAQLLEAKLNDEIALLEQKLKESVSLDSSMDSISVYSSSDIIDIHKRIELRESHLSVVRKYIKNDPCSNDSILFALELMRDAAFCFLETQLKLTDKVVESQGPELANSIKNQITWAQASINNDFSLLRIGLNETRVEAIGIFKKQIINTLRSKDCFNDLDIKRELKEAEVFVLNVKEWNPIRNSITIFSSDGPYNLESHIIPVKNLGNIFNSTYQNIGGVCAHFTTETYHATNLAKTQLLYDGEILFSGYRHGVLCAYGIKEQNVREIANMNRAREVLQAVVVGDETLLDLAVQESTFDNPLKIEMLSINLQTPDHLRSASSVVLGHLYDERMQIKEQMQAWNNLNNTVQKIPILNKEGIVTEVYIQPSIHMANFGVNSIALEGIGKISSKSKLLGSWDDSLGINQETIDYLFGKDYNRTLGGKVHEFLRDKTIEEGKKEFVTILSLQILNIYNRQAYKEMGLEPYKIVTRLAYLSHLIGIIPLFNCKSGKDRTGVLDSELKFLIARSCWEGTIPHPDIELDPINQQLLRQFMFGAGSLELQKMNTGIAGYKPDNKQTLARIGGEHVAPYLRGASAFVRA